MESSSEASADSVRGLAAQEPGLGLLVLVGSRARGTPHDASDWDFAYRGGADLDPDRLRARLSLILGTDRIDLADLDHANGLFRFRSCRDGRVIFDRDGTFDRFCFETISFWCDMGPIIEAEYEALLANLPPMTPLDRHVLAERTAAIERHLERVRQRLPRTANDLVADADAADIVILHLWQATQATIDIATALCVHLRLGAPRSYADAFRRLAQAARLDAPLAERLARAAGFRNVVAHAYGTIDLVRVHEAATRGPTDLRRFLAVTADALRPA